MKNRIKEKKEKIWTIEDILELTKDINLNYNTKQLKDNSPNLDNKNNYNKNKDNKEYDNNTNNNIINSKAKSQKRTFWFT